MDIVCSIDDNYVQHCCVMLTSFFENNLNEKHTVHLITEGLSSQHRETIQRVIANYSGKFNYHLIDSHLLSSFPIKETDHLTIATYYRLFMAEILPNTLDKVLYLDSDIVINTSLQELWNTSLDDYAIGAIEELGCTHEDVYERLGFSKDYGYFNAGVLLINLAYWRTYELTQVFSDYITQNAAKLKAHDQDTLNALLHNKCLHLPVKWNVEEAFYHYAVIKRLKDNQSLREALYSPSILHYTWKPKPWEPDCKHPFRVNYYIYLKKIPGIGKNPLSMKQRLRSRWDRWSFRFLIKWGITGHRLYRL